MNEEAQKLFDSIVIKDVTGLTVGDIEFLRARSSYLTSDQKEKFESKLHLKVSDKKKTEVKEEE